MNFNLYKQALHLEMKPDSKLTKTQAYAFEILCGIVAPVLLFEFVPFGLVVAIAYYFLVFRTTEKKYIFPNVRSSLYSFRNVVSGIVGILLVTAFFVWGTFFADSIVAAVNTPTEQVFTSGMVKGIVLFTFIVAVPYIVLSVNHALKKDAKNIKGISKEKLFS